MLFLAKSGQHDHRQRAPVHADTPAHLNAIEERKHTVEHHEVGLHGLGLAQAGEPVDGFVHDEPGGAQVLPDHLGHHGVVLDDEHAAAGEGIRSGRRKKLGGRHPLRLSARLPRRARTSFCSITHAHPVRRPPAPPPGIFL